MVARGRAKADGMVVGGGDNDNGKCDTGSWRDIVAVAVGVGFTVGLKADGTVAAVGNIGNGRCNTGSWRDIGPVSEEKRIEWKHRAEQELKEQQSKIWREQGLCKYCGGKLGGLFSKKCKACGREN